MNKAALYTLEHIDDQWQATDQATLLFVVEQNKVLLIRKKRGLGAGVTQSQKLARLKFQFIDGYSIDVHAFVATEYQGTPTETDEAEPLWFAISDIPYHEMWADDRIWLPRVLSGDTASGKFIFAGDALLEHEVMFKVELND